MIPVYNEVLVVPKVISPLVSLGYRVICVDDGSSDGSYESCSSFKEVELLRHVVNRGQGAALATAFEYLKRNRLQTKYVVTFDSDGQHNPANIKEMVDYSHLNSFDLVLGNRFGSYSNEIPKLKKVLLKLGVSYVRLVKGIDIHDIHNGFRCLNIAVLECFLLRQDGYEHADEIINLAIDNNLKIGEFPVSISYTEYSKSKGQPLINSLNILFKRFWI